MERVLEYSPPSKTVKKNIFFNRNISSRQFNFDGDMVSLAKKIKKQLCPACYCRSLEFHDLKVIGSKNADLYLGCEDSRFNYLEFLCVKNGCEQISCAVIEVSIGGDFNVIGYGTEEEKKLLYCELSYNNEEWVFKLCEATSFNNYPVRIITTCPEDLIPERAFFCHSKEALFRCIKNKKKLIKAETWVHDLANKVRNKDDSFFPLARKFLEFLVPIAGGFKKEAGMTLSALNIKAAEVGRFKRVNVLPSRPIGTVKNHIADSFIQQIGEIIKSQGEQAFASERKIHSFVKKITHGDLFSTDLNSLCDIKLIEKKVETQKIHSNLDELRIQLNKHCHDGNAPNDDDFIFVCESLNNLFYSIKKIFTPN